MLHKQYTQTIVSFVFLFFSSYDCGFFAILYLENFDGVVMASFNQVSCYVNENARPFP